MRKIDFAEPETDQWLEWRKSCDEEQRALIDDMAAGGARKIKPDIYKGKKQNIKEDVFMDPEGAFFGKCAFCEQDIHGNQHGDIEHFRPKGGVKDESGSSILIDVDGKRQPHPGYYWLCYDWKNLLPSCVLCNQPSTRAGGKRNSFPVAGFRAAGPGEEIKEEPLLINPCLDDPSEDLAFEENGTAVGKTEKGRTSIRILGLNSRNLPDKRAKAYKDTCKSVGLTMIGWALAGSATVSEEDMRQLQQRVTSHEFTRMSQMAISSQLTKASTVHTQVAGILDEDPNTGTVA